MQKTKDPLFTPVLPKLPMKWSGQTPNILRKPSITKPVSHPLTVPLKQPTFIITQILRNPAPLVKRLDSLRNENIEVVILDDSDVSDVETEDGSMKVINDSDVDESNMTEIVVEENQIFQLQDHASIRMETPTSSDFVDSVQPAQNEDELPTICHDDALQPVHNINDDEPAVTRIEDETVETLEETLSSVENVSTTNINAEERVETTVTDITEVDETPSSTEPTIEISICRTCLKPVRPNTCRKLFDTENQRKCSELRQKLFEVIESIDLQASLNPAVCSECFEAIQTAHSFRKRVKDVEEQIGKRKKGVIPIDLKVMLEEVALEKLGKLRGEYKRKKRGSCKILEGNLEQYLEKRKQIIDKYISSLKDDNPSPKTKPTNGIGASKTPSSTNKILTKKHTSNTCASPLDSHNSQSSVAIPQNILLNNSQNGNCIIEIVDGDDKRQNTLSVPNLESNIPNIESTVPNKTSTVSNKKPLWTIKPTVPNLESSTIGIKPITVPSVQSSKTFVSVLKPTAPNLKPRPTKVKCTAPNLESNIPNKIFTASNINSTVPNLESCRSFVSVLKPSNVESKVPTTGSSIPVLNCAVPVTEPSTVGTIWSIDLTAPIYTVPNVQKNVAPFQMIKPSSGSSLDAFLARRQEACKRMGNMGPRKSVVLNEGTEVMAEEKRNRKAEDAYNYLFNTNVIKKKKPQVPKSFDIFDEEHDKYFKDLEGEAGCFMVRKWKRFSNRQQGFGEGPFLCEDCGKVFVKQRRFKQHVDHHMGRDIAICSYCGIKIRTYRLKEHIMARHKPPRYECKDCGKKFHLKYLLRSHVTLMHKFPNRRYQCQVCGVLLRKNSLVTHMRKHDSSGKKYICELCRKVFDNQVSWYCHRRKHSSKVFTCNICSKPIKSRYNLNKHMKAYHEGGQIRACNICGMMLSKRQSLTRHMQISHRLKPKVLRRKRMQNKQMSEQEEINQTAQFISSDADQDNFKAVTEIQEEVIYESVVEAPMGLEEIEVPYNTIDGRF